MPERMPMFPLNNGLVPGALLPLRIFEERYLTMVEACFAADREFGLVLIERGSEVGGGDQRCRVGMVAKIMGMRTIAVGTTLITVRGVQRMWVVDWIKDNPYPQAMIERIDDPTDWDVDPRERRRFDEAFARGVGLLAESGIEAGAAMALPADVGAAAFQAIALIPMEDHDRQLILEIDDPAERLRAAVSALVDTNELTTLRLSSS